jgi:hypothetical protein
MEAILLTRCTQKSVVSTSQRFYLTHILQACNAVPVCLIRLIDGTTDVMLVNFVNTLKTAVLFSMYENSVLNFTENELRLS